MKTGVIRCKGEWGPWSFVCPVCGNIYSGSRTQMAECERYHMDRFHPADKPVCQPQTQPADGAKLT